ncbi:MAG: HAMP domain-containing protein [Desulfovibrionaceae bacterium]|nr:HAMP domain-containing protein [Desulfovibrionaceae bacterium]MBF0513112.1 HAMP domain-containing protein [Desulfovibrionaceae bacterium]
MKIKTGIVLSGFVNVALIVVIAAFAYHDLNRILTKLAFVEIADDLNTLFLEMRLSEKNYFLSNDPGELADIKERLASAKQVVGSMRGDIVRATGAANYAELVEDIGEYGKTFPEAGQDRPPDADAEARIRSAGKKLREFSETLIRLERKEVHRIIDNSTNGMLLSFWAILLSTVALSPVSSRRILNALKKIETLTKSISQGRFDKIEEHPGNNEIASVIRAVNSMSQELRNREEELLQTKKLASLGILTAGVAHEITNPLNNISMIAQTFEQSYGDLDETMRLEFMKKVENEAERIKNVVINLLDFSKPKQSQRLTADVRELVEHTMALVRNMLDVSAIDTALDLPQGLPPVLVDEHQIHQVLVNLITNAIQAMAPGGRLSVAVRAVSGGAAVEIEVRDTGKGIAPEHLSHVFDPFFSTKGVGGTGLGLSISYGIVKNHHGSIRVESEAGKGTAFTVTLPAITSQNFAEE